MHAPRCVGAGPDVASDPAVAPPCDDDGLMTVGYMDIYSTHEVPVYRLTSVRSLSSVACYTQYVVARCYGRPLLHYTTYISQSRCVITDAIYNSQSRCVALVHRRV